MKCESCGRQTDFMAGFFSCDSHKQRWSFECSTCPSIGYVVAVNRFFSSPGGTVDWIAHLSEKRWFNAGEFVKFIHWVRGAASGEGL